MDQGRTGIDIDIACCVRLAAVWRGPLAAVWRGPLAAVWRGPLAAVWRDHASGVVGFGRADSDGAADMRAVGTTRQTHDDVR